MPISNRPFMGTTPYDTGKTFRVWAPFANAITVGGSFNAWSMSANALFAEGNGFWSVDVAGVKIGAQYKFGSEQESHEVPDWRGFS